MLYELPVKIATKTEFAVSRHAVLLAGPDDVGGFQLSIGEALEIFASYTVFDPTTWGATTLSRQQSFPVILLDATQGIRELDRVHAHLAKFFPHQSLLVLVGRMDEIDFEQEQFDLIAEEYRNLLSSMGIEASAMLPAPLTRLPQMNWYDGPPLDTVIASLEQTAAGDGAPLRIRVGSAVAENGNWHLEGDLLSGQIDVGDTVLSSPSNQTAIVSAIQKQPDTLEGTLENRKIGLVFDDAFFADPGEILSHETNAPVETDVFRAYVTWGNIRAVVGETFRCETLYGEFAVTLQSIDLVLNPGEGAILSCERLEAGACCEIVLRSEKIVTLDSFSLVSTGGHFQLVDANEEPRGAGFISMEGYADQRRLLTAKATNITPVQYALTDKDRSDRNGHEGGVLWFTGLSGSGKSTLAMALEARLFEKGFQVFVMDGDNVRQGLTSNLGFSPDDRAENIRRVGEVAALFRQAGLIVISSFISPYRSDRDRARHAAQSGFHEIYIKAGVETCIARDPKGLYERALRGEIRDFTGISAPYEEPAAADLIINTEREGIEACVERLVKYVDRNFRV